MAKEDRWSARLSETAGAYDSQRSLLLTFLTIVLISAFYGMLQPSSFVHRDGMQKILNRYIPLLIESKLYVCSFKTNIFSYFITSVLKFLS